MSGPKDLLSIVSEDYYPIVQLPNIISECLNDKNFNDIKDEDIIKEFSLTKPIETNRPISPSKPNENKYNSGTKKVIIKKGGYWWLFFSVFHILIGFIGLILIKNSSLEGEELQGKIVLLVLISILPSIVSLIVFFKKLSYENSYELIPLPMHEREQLQFDYREKEVQYQSKLKKHIENFNSELSNFNKSIEQNRSRFFIKKYFEALIESRKPIRAINPMQKGKVEVEFLKHLIKVFPNKIMIDMQLGSYFPDFVYESKQYGFYIDIEIDEQYEIVTKKPIHYVGSNDENRNEFFKQNNWFIIRFAEEQVIRDPESCCQFIDNVIRKITNPQEIIVNFPANLPRIKRWSYEDSFIDGQENKRG